MATIHLNECIYKVNIDFDTQGTVTVLQAKGEKGDTGATGPANTLSIGTVTKGNDAAAAITGTAPNQTLNLTLPKGDKGDTGSTGATGNDGISPTVSISKSGKVTTVVITDKDGPHTATINDGADGSGTGDMLKSTYDTNANGIVDNAEKVNNHTVEKDVPSSAVFTDTQSNWNETSTTSKAYIQNKPTIISLTLSTTDIGEGATLAANTLYGVYE